MGSRDAVVAAADPPGVIWIESCVPKGTGFMKSGGQLAGLWTPHSLEEVHRHQRNNYQNSWIRGQIRKQALDPQEQIVRYR